MPGQGLATFARHVAEGSGGRLTVQPSFDAALGIKSAAMFEAVRSGRLEAGDAFAPTLAPVDAIFALSALPFLATSIDDARRLADLARPAYEEAARRFGQRLLYVTPWPASGIWSKTPITGPGDLNGLAIRTYDATSTDVLTAAGARAVNISFADAMPKLKDGSVEAVLSSGDGGAGRRLWEFLPHFTEVNYALPLSVATVSLKAYEALPADLRSVVDRAAEATERELWRIVATRLDANYARMRENGVTINTAPGDALLTALRRAGRPAVERWAAAAGSSGAALLDRFGTK